MSTTLFEDMLEHVRRIDQLRSDPSCTRDGALDAWELMISQLMGKVVSTPTATSFCIWRHSEEQGDG